MPQVKHIGIFSFKDEVTSEQIDHCFSELKGLVDLIPGLMDMSHGPYASEEGLNQGFTHGFIMTFESPEARDAYLPNPVHERVKDMIIPLLEQFVIFDYNLEG